MAAVYGVFILLGQPFAATVFLASHAGMMQSPTLDADAPGRPPPPIPGGAGLDAPPRFDEAGQNLPLGPEGIGGSLTLGPFAIAPGGTLTPRRADQRPMLRFAWRGRPCEAELGADSLRLATLAARIPSSAASGADRPGALAALAGLAPSMPKGWRLRLLPDHRISLEATAPFDAPPTAVGLLAELVRFALALDPYLDRLEASGAEVPGRLNTCPG